MKNHLIQSKTGGIMAEITEADKKTVDPIVAKVKKAQKLYSTYTQDQVDAIFKAAAIAAGMARIPLAKMAVAETGMGIVEDKVIKNHFSAEYIYNAYKNTKTCGTICESDSLGFEQIAEPMGVIAGVIPTTNPTSTAIFKALISLKTRNGIIFSPHPRAKKCTNEAAKIVLDAAVKAGAPKDIVAWIDEPTLGTTSYLMSHKDVSLILATGGPGMVKSAYSSGTPAIGVGAGNTPVIIDATADIQMAVSSVIISKTFDNGMICASEQSVIVEKPVYIVVKKEFIDRGCYFVSEAEKQKLKKVLFKDGKLNAAIVGQPAAKIADMAGIKVPAATKVLMVETSSVDISNPFAHEKLSPILAFYKADTFPKAVDMAQSLVELGGAGHTSVLYTAESSRDRIALFSKTMTTGRTLINMPASQGAIGDIYNFKLPPSLTLGCGSWGKNSVSENIGVKHLMNIKSVAKRRENMLWFKVPPKIYFKRGCLDFALAELKGHKRAFIITDKTMTKIGLTDRIGKVLEQNGMTYQVFDNVNPDPDLSSVYVALEQVKRFDPDVFVAVGGGSPMDAAKIIWLLYEHPELTFEEVAMRFMDIRKRTVEFPKMGIKSQMVCIPTTSGTGSEVTPFTVITDDKTDKKYPIADYELLPQMAIVDPDLVMSMPDGVTIYAGLDVLTHALESYVSVYATSMTDGLSLEAAKLVFEYLPRSYKKKAADPIAREKMHYAATVAGMAFGNAFLGINHSLAHKLGGHFHVIHGLANALLMPHVIRYNATDKPNKQGLFPQYRYPFAKKRYAEFADAMGITNGLKETQIDEKIERLIDAIESLKKELNVPASIKALGISEKDFLAKIDVLSEEAFDDQCTGANPRYPLISEIKEIYMDTYYGKGISKVKEKSKKSKK
ncbi:MAG: bifunctional acetaldehyde-CoA/alcohol dehydrogenase [Lactobacillales bacterium]|nr:bifunctional acetaldehyde-CoA/alcohol dehydrogenase [Lactobacillales bacterium]